MQELYSCKWELRSNSIRNENKFNNLLIVAPGQRGIVGDEQPTRCTACRFFCFNHQEAILNLQERFNQIRINLSKRIAPKNIGDEYLDSVMLYGGSSAGVSVTPLSSLRTSAVLGCYRVITESVASLPLLLYRRLERGKARAPEHPLFNLLRFEANEEMSAYQWIETSIGHMVLWGNCYSELTINGQGKITAMTPIKPERVWPQRNKETGAIEYKVTNSKGGTRIVRKELMFHVPFLSLNGINGISPIGFARLSVGLSVAAEEYGAAFFENGATPKIILSHPTTLSAEAQKRLKKNWDEQNQGPKQAHKVQVLEEGLKAETISIPPNDAQFLETRKFQIEEIARIYRVPPHMLADLDKATFSNIEHQSLEFVMHSLRPWLVRWEQGIHQQLLLNSEKKTFFAEFMVDSLLRGDITSRYNAYHQAKMDGWMSSNDIREKESMNPIDNGDDYWQPVNMLVVGEGDPFGNDDTRSSFTERSAGTDTRARDNAIAARRQSTLSWRPMIKDAAQRILKKEQADLRKLVKDAFGKRNVYSFDQLVTHYYNQDFEQFVYRRMAGVFDGFGSEVALYAAQETGNELEDVVDRGYLERFIARYTNAFISAHIADSKARLAKAVEDGEKKEAEGVENGVEETLNAELNNWEEQDSSIANDQGTQLNGAISQKVFALAGILEMAWKVFGDSCPYCRALDGKVVGINENFLSAGISLTVDDENTPPLIPQRNKKHPPAHGGCDCGIVAVI